VDYNGLIHLRARYYDPTVGGFLCREPSFGNTLHPVTLNRFACGRDNPVLLFDPSGHVAIQQAQAIGAAEGLSCQTRSLAHVLERHTVPLPYVFSGKYNDIDWIPILPGPVKRFQVIWPPPPNRPDVRLCHWVSIETVGLL